MDIKKISDKTITEVLKRSKGKCEGCGCYSGGNRPHHIFFKSQYYGKDRNLSWNLADLCETNCHRIIHHAGTDAEVKRKNALDYKLKKDALCRYRGKSVQELTMLTKRAYLKTK